MCEYSVRMFPYLWIPWSFSVNFSPLASVIRANFLVHQALLLVALIRVVLLSALLIINHNEHAFSGHGFNGNLSFFRREYSGALLPLGFQLANSKLHSDDLGITAGYPYVLGKYVTSIAASRNLSSHSHSIEPQQVNSFCYLRKTNLVNANISEYGGINGHVIRVGSRWSPLALQQSRDVVRKIAFSSPTQFPKAIETFLKEEVLGVKTDRRSNETDFSTKNEKLQKYLTSTSAGELSATASAAACEMAGHGLNYGELIIVPFQSSADKKQSSALGQVGGKGLFTKELDDALISNNIDLAVHSLKDVPTVLTNGTKLAALLPRHDARDALIYLNTNKERVFEYFAKVFEANEFNKKNGYDSMKSTEKCFGSRFLTYHILKEDRAPRFERGVYKDGNMTLGSTSLRRQALLGALLPTGTFSFHFFRGNVQTRLRKIREKVVNVTVLAAAGLNRLELLKEPIRMHKDSDLRKSQVKMRNNEEYSPLIESNFASPYEDIGVSLMSSSLITPAVGQGIVGVQIRNQDTWLQRILLPIHCNDSRKAAECERAFLKGLDGSCRTPIAGYARMAESNTVNKSIRKNPHDGNANVSSTAIPGVGSRNLYFDGVISSPDGSESFNVTFQGAVKTDEDAQRIGREAAKLLKEQAGEEFLAKVKQDVVEGWANLKK